MAPKLTFIEQEWTRQPRHLVKVDPRNPLGQFAAVCIPGIGVFGTASPVAQFKVNTSVSINKTGAIWYQSGTSTNAGVSLGSSSGLDLSVSSGVIECIDWSTASNQMPLFRTGAMGYKDDDFYIDLLNNKVRLIKANVVVILESSNSVSPGGVARISWSYNGATGRTSLAVNGVLTTGISAQTFNHSGNAIVCGYDELSPIGTYPSNISLFAISPKECFDDAALIRLSLNPWQIFEPEEIPLFKPIVTAQYARPVSDVSAGGWTASTGSDLFAMLDEAAADDGDYITTTSASTCEVALGSLSDPAVSTGHIVRYQLSADAGGITVRLRQGTTTIATWTHAPAPASLTLYEQTLSSGEANSITDYTALRLQFEATA